jgi:hypothetical protein
MFLLILIPETKKSNSKSKNTHFIYLDKCFFWGGFQINKSSLYYYLTDREKES